MAAFLFHFLLGLIGSAAIFLAFHWLSPARRSSVPFGLIFLAVACGVLAVYLSGWMTLAVLLAYAAISFREYKQDRRFAQEQASSISQESSGEE